MNRSVDAGDVPSDDVAHRSEVLDSVLGAEALLGKVEELEAVRDFPKIVNGIDEVEKLCPECTPKYKRTTVAF